ncbi:MAG: hypothetical protein HY763_01515 [Planctomycetes bacterium]|nr:hypothetical protein [Planctomycetota bacterium]
MNWSRRIMVYFVAPILVSFLAGVLAATVVYYLYQVRHPPRLQITEQSRVNLLAPIHGIGYTLPLNVEWDKGLGENDPFVRLPNLYMSRFELSNAGGEPLQLRTLLERPITFTLFEEGTLLGAQLEAVPEAPKIILTRVQKTRSFSLEFDSLQPGERFSVVTFHTAPKEGGFSLEGRLFDHPPLCIQQRQSQAVMAVPLRDAAFVGLIILTVGTILGSGIALVLRKRFD